jgi:two-component system nitrogen regulation sensor histidine kinase GlnL
MDRALLLNEESARQSGIILSRLYDPSLPDVIGSEDQLVQVFLNIVKNAVEAMPGGGKLTVTTRMSDLFTSVQADGKKHRLMVVKITDTGPGIKQEHLEDIFTPFFTTKDRGVGLGLALSYQIVQEHLGTIRVREPAERRYDIQRVSSTGGVRRHGAWCKGVDLEHGSREWNW